MICLGYWLYIVPVLFGLGDTDSIQFRSSWKKYLFLKYFIGLLALSSSNHKLMKHQLIYPYLHQYEILTHSHILKMTPWQDYTSAVENIMLIEAWQL